MVMPVPTNSSSEGEYLFPYCEWFTTASRNCGPDGDVHFALKVASVVLSVVAVVLALAYFALRYRGGHGLLTRTGRVGAIDGTVLIFGFSLALRAIDAALIVSDSYINYYARYTFMVIPWALHFEAGAYFLYAVAHSIPNAYLSSKGEMKSTLMPPRWTFLLFIGFEAIGVACGITAAGIYLGVLYEQQGGLLATDRGFTVLFSLWSVFNSLLAFAYLYYGNLLIKVIENNYVGSRFRSDAMARAIRKMKLLMYGIAPLLIVCTLVTIFMAVFHQAIFTHSASSIIFACFFHFSIQIMEICLAGTLIVMELMGTIDSSIGGDENNVHSSVKEGAAPQKSSDTNSNKKLSDHPSTILQEALASMVDIEENRQPLSLHVLAL